MFTFLVAAVVGAGEGVVCFCVLFLCGLASKAGFGPCPLCYVDLLSVLILYLGLCLYLLFVGNKIYLLSKKK